MLNYGTLLQRVLFCLVTSKILLNLNEYQILALLSILSGQPISTIGLDTLTYKYSFKEKFICESIAIQKFQVIFPRSHCIVFPIANNCSVQVKVSKKEFKMFLKKIWCKKKPWMYWKLDPQQKWWLTLSTLKCMCVFWNFAFEG